MARLTVSDDLLTVDVQGLHQLWGLSAASACLWPTYAARPPIRASCTSPRGLRAPGLHVPGATVIGTFHRDGEKHFWDVRSGDHAVVIELTGETYDRLIVDVDDPRSAVDTINRALSRPRS